MKMPWFICGQRTSSRSWFSPIMLVPGMSSSDSPASTFTYSATQVKGLIWAKSKQSSQMGRFTFWMP